MRRICKASPGWLGCPVFRAESIGVLASLLVVLTGGSEHRVTAESRSAVDHGSRAQEPDAPPRLEFEDDPYLSGTRLTDGPTTPSVVQFGPFISVQVNVDARGGNIPGDAGNETSLAISPVNPNLMVIGFRQFDNVASNFRRAGRAYSTDGGATWTFPGPLDPGVFRSDPVLDVLTNGTFLYNSLCGTGCNIAFLCDMFLSTDALNWSGPIPAFGGDKQWMTTDKTNGPGSDHIYFSWSTAAGCCGTDIFTRSTDGGLTYMTPIPLPSSPVWGTLTVGPDGALYISGISGSSYRVIKSTNAQFGGETPTFSPAVTVLMGGSPSNITGPNPGGLLGQVWIASDHSGVGSPTHGNLYTVVSCNPAGTDPMDVRFARSSDGGTTWSSSVRINDDPAHAAAWQWFGTMDVALNGRIDVFWNDTRQSLQTNMCATFYAYSYDGGVTWSRNFQVSPGWNSFIGWPNQNKIGDYYQCISDIAAANFAYAATFNGEQDVWFLRAGDCNGNGVHDGLDISQGTSCDINDNGIPDECEGLDCLADVAPPGGGNGVVNIDDLLAIISGWGPAPPGSLLDIAPPCTGNGAVDIDDLLVVIDAWGVCP